MTDIHGSGTQQRQNRNIHQLEPQASSHSDTAAKTDQAIKHPSPQIKRFFSSCVAMSSFARSPGDSGSVLRPSSSSQILKAADDGADPKQSRPTRHHHHDGLPKPNLGPLHRSSSPSAVVSRGKENGNHHSQYQVVARHSQPPANILRHQRAGNLRNSAETPDATQGQASPRAGIREEAKRQKIYPSRPGSDYQKDRDAEGINRDFERLLVSPFGHRGVAIAHIRQ